MRAFFCFLILLAGTILTSCKKNKSIVYSGQFLLSPKYPIPITNKPIAVYQQGSSAIIINTSSSTATTVTDASGFFSLNFTPGRVTFAFFNFASNYPLYLKNAINDTSHPTFSRKNFPETGYDPAKPIFIGKTIDTTIIMVNLISDLAPTDTIGLRALTINERLNKEYTNRLGSAGSIIILDTIYNMLFTDFDCLDNRFSNNLYAGRKWTTVWVTRQFRVKDLLYRRNFPQWMKQKKK